MKQLNYPLETLEKWTYLGPGGSMLCGNAEMLDIIRRNEYLQNSVVLYTGRKRWT